MKKVASLVLALFLPTLVHSWGLTYRVHNGTSAVVKFNSSDWLDWGTRVYSGQTASNTYYFFPPKNMSLTFYNYEGSRFTIQTSAACELVGLPYVPKPSEPIYQLKGEPVRLAGGTIDITVTDLPNSSHHHKYISCSVVTDINHF